MQQALVLKGGRKHHISPRLRVPAPADAAGCGWRGRRQRPGDRANAAGIPTIAVGRHAGEREEKPNHSRRSRHPRA